MREETGHLGVLAGRETVQPEKIVLPLNPHEKGPKNLIQQTEYKLKMG